MTVTDQDPAPLAVITGGAGDVGVATAEHMIRDGWRVVLADRDLTGARTRVAELG
ncbi:MAG: hypothetical protein L0H93_06710 [Nocardioides sp.]|nr:hypothetical protein [Nocardioides sp.]